ncbi:hypothetical protein K2X14_03235 [Acetobacter sp. TBRC 12305]|uniref:Uncharacterized protein n=1 Tax=Acetobacter garciniae TaxID=2817435 RepID=A0A939HGX3_9PROT|nr:hypothetical protein [Acetobacter garciniae]MBO1324170.1 hypothetical protein [Acetobacter garciniae]MBX0343859.1 hypothetical protein [Acetobacter garciniae]
MLYDSETSGACNIIPFQMEILSRHRDYLSRWVEAGMPMGVSDADIFPAEQKQAGVSSGYVLVWVRETPDPAYKVYSRGNRWVVMDAIRDTALGNFNSFSDALHMIRPVLPREQNIVAA